MEHFICPECGADCGEYHPDGGEPDCHHCMAEAHRIRALEADAMCEDGGDLVVTDEDIERDREMWNQEIAREEGMLNGIDSFNDWSLLNPITER